MDNGKKRPLFSWNFDLFLTFLIDYSHFYVPKGRFVGAGSYGSYIQVANLTRLGSDCDDGVSAVIRVHFLTLGALLVT